MGIATYLLSYGAALLSVALVATYLYFTRNFAHWRKKGIKHLKPLPFVGNLKDVALMRKCIGLVANDIYEQHKKEPFIGLFAFDEPVLQIHDLEIVKAVLIKDFQHFMERRAIRADVDPLIAKGLFGLRGDQWRYSRNALTPSFTSGKMKRMYELVEECGKLLTHIVEKEDIAGKPVPIYEVAARYTTDVIASCAFGIQGNTLTDPKAEFRRKLRSSFEFSAWQSIVVAAAFLAPKIVGILGLKMNNSDVENFVTETITTTVKERETHQIKRNDLLDSLIELKNPGRIPEDKKHTEQPTHNFRFDNEDVCAHSFAFLTAGFETSATTISYALFELAKHKDVQDKLRAEIQGASADGRLPYEALHGMKYLDMVVQETMRKYPPLPFLDRVCSKAYTLPGTKLTLEEGCRVLIPLYGFQRDPEFHPNPMNFDPERFSAENKKNITNYTHMPFGEGPRNCVGARFAMMQTKCAIANLLLSYTVDVCSSTPKEIQFNPKNFLLQPRDSIDLVLRPIV